MVLNSINELVAENSELDQKIKLLKIYNSNLNKFILKSEKINHTNDNDQDKKDNTKNVSYD